MDEISQVVELECKGVYYLLQGTKSVIAYLAERIVALSEWGKERALKKEGNCSWEKIQKVSEGNPVLLNFPKEMFEKTLPNPDQSHGAEPYVSAFDLYCHEHKLRYCTMPDLNPEDDYLPIAVPAQDAGIHSEQIKHFMKKKVEAGEAKDKAYDERIQEAKEELANAKTEDEKKAATEKLKGLEEAKSENSENLKSSKEQMEKDNVLEFSEYLKMGKDTLFETDPKAALNQEQICGMVKEFMPYDCMYPIRDEGTVPDSKEVFYSQKSGEDSIRTVQRTFKTDEDGIVYSTYKVVDPKEPGNIRIFSDKGISKEDWKEQLPELLKEAGMMSNVPTAAIRSKDRLRKYVEGLDGNFIKAPKETEGQEKGYSSEETKKYVEAVAFDNERRAAYEESLFTTVTVPASAIMADGEQVLSLELTEGLVKNVDLVSMDKEEAQVKIKSDAIYVLDREGGKSISLTGGDVIKAIGKSAGEEASKNIHKSASRK